MKCNIHQKNFPKSINDNKYIAELQEYDFIISVRYNFYIK